MARHGGPSRKPPIAVRRALAPEDGFGCPVEGCARPYLTWHHFDPEWHVEHHHRPEGMVALCREHHDKAGAGAFTTEQLRLLKRVGAENTRRVAGTFDILRQDLAFKVGSNWFVETPRMVVYRDHPLIWFSRDAENVMRLSLRVPGPRGPRLQMDENYWSNLADASLVECPPKGTDLLVEYPDGDRVSIRFSPSDEETRVVAGDRSTRVAIELRLQFLGLDFAQDLTTIGTNTMQDCVTANCQTVLAIG